MTENLSGLAELVRQDVMRVYRSWLDAGYGAPKLITGKPGEYRIMWEEGPFEWALHYSGAIGSDITYLVHEPEFGTKLGNPVRIAGTFLEPAYSYELCIYRN